MRSFSVFIKRKSKFSEIFQASKRTREQNDFLSDGCGYNIDHALLLGGAGILQEMASKSEDHYSLLFVSLSFILCLSYSLTYFTPLYPVLILTHHYITVTLLLLPLVLYRLSTSEERGTLHSKGRRLPIYVGWVHWST